jgi:ribosome-binding factor A
MSYRPERLAEAIKKEVSDMLFQEIRDPRIGFVTITAVEVSSDLRSAKIFTSVYGSSAEQKTTMEALTRAQGYIRGELGKRIRLRYTPDIVFVLDKSIVQGARVIKLLKDIKDTGENLS